VGASTRQVAELGPVADMGCPQGAHPHLVYRSVPPPRRLPTPAAPRPSTSGSGGSLTKARMSCPPNAPAEIVCDRYNVPDEVPREEHEQWPDKTEAVTDSFASEIVKLSPPNLTRLTFVGCPNLRRVVVSPMGSCPMLRDLNLSQCDSLEYVLVQSEAVESIKLSLCGNLKKILLHCKNLSSLDLRECLSLESIVIWSDLLDSLDIMECRKVKQLELHCPSIGKTRTAPLVLDPRAISVKHAPIALLRAHENARDRAEEEKEHATFFKEATSNATVPKTFRTL